ncbi:MAG: SEC-C metal-binding domain-containing protein, partial [Gemmatimonadota bacterium]
TMSEAAPTRAAWAHLYSLAAEVRALAPWEFLGVEQVLGVRPAGGGEPLFVAAMGQAGELLGVSAYLGTAGLRGYLDLQRAGEHGTPEQVLEIPNLQAFFVNRSELDPEDRAVVEGLGLSRRGPRAWPQFRSYRPGYLPWFLVADEAQVLTTALEQMLEVGPRARREPGLLGPGDGRTFLVRVEEDGEGPGRWSERQETILLPEPVLEVPPAAPEQVQRLGRLRRGRAVWELSLFPTTSGIGDENARLQYPYVLLLVEQGSGLVKGVELLTVETDLAAMLARVPEALARLLEKAGELPAGMCTDSPRAARLMRPLAEALDVPVEEAAALPDLDEARSALEAQLSGRREGRPGAGRGSVPAAAPEGRGAPEPDPEVPSTAPPGPRVGRNAPCPCGSGRKYKKCCLLKEQAQANELTPRILARCAQDADELLVKHARKAHGASSLIRAWLDFWFAEEEELDQLEPPDESPWLTLFGRWMTYLWIPAESEDEWVESDFPSDGTVVAGFLKAGAPGADEPTRQYLEAARRTPLCFHEVVALEPGRGALLRDLVTDQERFVHDRDLSELADPWDLVLCQVVELGEVAVLGAAGPYALPPAQCREAVERELAPCRELVRQDPGSYAAELLEGDADLIGVYRALLLKLEQAPAPEVRNTDGDRLEWCRSTYVFEPAARGRVVERLEGMRNIEREDDGGGAAQFVWLSQRDQVAGQKAHKAAVTVTAGMLVTESNSRRRDRLLRDRLLKDLGEVLTFTDTDYESLDLDELPALDDAPEDEGAFDLDRLAPGDRARLEGALAGRYMHWADEEVPALGGRTPRETAKTPAGRRKVQKMVNDWENLDRRRANPQLQFDFNQLRRELGLPEE